MCGRTVVVVFHFMLFDWFIRWKESCSASWWRCRLLFHLFCFCTEKKEKCTERCAFSQGFHALVLTLSDLFHGILRNSATLIISVYNEYLFSYTRISIYNNILNYVWNKNNSTNTTPHTYRMLQVTRVFHFRVQRLTMCYIISINKIHSHPALQYVYVIYCQQVGNICIV